MELFVLILSLAALVVSAVVSPTSIGSQVRDMQQFADKVERTALPIPTFTMIDPETHALLKRNDDSDKLWLFGGYKTSKSSTDYTRMEAPFNKTTGSSWCNEIGGVGSESNRDNVLESVHVDSHKGWSSPPAEKRPPEYVCFFYESRGKCDPADGHAEYVESIPGSQNDTQFDTGKYKYISWGCQWNPKNKKCNPGGTGLDC